MTLIKCPECGNEVSTGAKACPKCGAKVKKPTSVITIIVGMIFTAAMLKAIVNSNSNPSQPAKSGADVQNAGTTLLAEQAKNNSSRQHTRCTEAAEELARSAMAAMKAKRPGDSEYMLRPCLQFDDAPAKLKKLHADAKQAFDAAEKKRKRSEGVTIGMTQADVLASSWGKPQKINRTHTTQRTREQWVYGNGNYLYFEDGILSSVQN